MLDLKTLEDGHSTGLSSRNGGFLAEAASVCLDKFKHPEPVDLPLTGSSIKTYTLKKILVDDLARSSFADLTEAAEFGAMGIAILIINDLTGWTVKRSWKGTGFDYWVGDPSTGQFEGKLRLEVSGTLESSHTGVQSRLQKKMEQTRLSDGTKKPACAIVVEFSNPHSMIDR